MFVTFFRGRFLAGCVTIELKAWLSAARFVRKHYNNALVAISYPVADALVVRPP